MMLRLKGQTKTGEWVKFEASSICRADKTYMIVWTGYDPYYELLLIETIQPADDPRKQMLDAIREKINNLTEYKTKEGEIMSGIKLKAKRKNTDDWLLFGITELFHGENGYFQVCVEDVGFFVIIPSTIRPADDPRKAMLKALRQRLLLESRPVLNYAYEGRLYLSDANAILDEMEAKL